jgi:hypothetical protein
MFAEEQRYVPSGAFLDLARKIPNLPVAALLDLGVSRHRLDTIAGGAALFATVLARLARPVVYIARSALREGVLVERQAHAARRAFHIRSRSLSENDRPSIRGGYLALAGQALFLAVFLAAFAFLWPSCWPCIAFAVARSALPARFCGRTRVMPS